MRHSSPNQMPERPIFSKICLMSFERRYAHSKPAEEQSRALPENQDLQVALLKPRRLLRLVNQLLGFFRN